MCMCMSWYQPTKKPLHSKTFRRLWPGPLHALSSATKADAHVQVQHVQVQQVQVQQVLVPSARVAKW